MTVIQSQGNLSYDAADFSLFKRLFAVLQTTAYSDGKTFQLHPNRLLTFDKICDDAQLSALK